MNEQQPKRKNLKRWFSILLTVVFCFTLLPATAYAASKDTLEKIKNTWNADEPASKSIYTSYKSSTQCQAFSRYVFVQLYGHTDGHSQKNNTVTTTKHTTASSLLNQLKTTAKPGDAIRVTASYGGLHIMHLYQVDSNGIHVYESNFTSGKDNKARFHTYSDMATFLEDTMIQVTKVNNKKVVKKVTVTNDKLSHTVTLNIIHAKENNGSDATEYVTATFNANGGTITKGNSTITVEKGKALGTLPTVSKSGCTFKGWYTNGGTKITSSTKITSNVTYYAQWTTNPTTAKPLIADGTYTLTPKSGPIHMRLDIKSGSKDNGGNAQIYTANTSAAQEFKFKFDSKTGTYTITNVNSGKVLDVQNGTNKSGTNVQQWSSNGTNAQKWKLVSAGSGYYYVVSALNDTLVLDVKSAGTANGTNVQVYTKNGSNAQQWKIQKVSEKTYYAKGTDGNLAINKTASAAQKIGDLPEGKAITIDTTIKSGKWWYGNYNGTSGYVYSSYLTTTAPTAKKATQIIKDGTYEVAPKHAPSMRLDVNGASKENKANVQIYKDNNSDAQKFKFKHLGNDYYSITCVASGKVLDVTGGSSKKGTNVQQYSWADVPAQRWKITSAGGGYYYISPDTNENLVLDVNNSGTANKTNVLVWTNNGQDNQKWKLY